MIFESRLIAATNADVLSIGRLNSIPYRGNLILQFLSDLGDATNNYSLTIQLPNGDVPVDSQQVNAGGGAALVGVMDTRMLMRFTFPVLNSGGHFTVSLTESGTALCLFQAILTP